MIYLSGAITHADKKQQQANIKRFYDLEEKLSLAGYEDVVNPAKLEVAGYEWEDYLARDLAFICEYKPELYMMKGWEQSKGARLELAMAKYLNLPLTYEE